MLILLNKYQSIKYQSINQSIDIKKIKNMNESKTLRQKNFLSGYSPSGPASKNYLPECRVNKFLLAQQRK